MPDLIQSLFTEDFFKFSVPESGWEREKGQFYIDDWDCAKTKQLTLDEIRQHPEFMGFKKQFTYTLAHIANTCARLGISLKGCVIINQFRYRLFDEISDNKPNTADLRPLYLLKPSFERLLYLLREKSIPDSFKTEQMKLFIPTLRLCSGGIITALENLLMSFSSESILYTATHQAVQSIAATTLNELDIIAGGDEVHVVNYLYNCIANSCGLKKLEDVYANQEMLIGKYINDSYFSVFKQRVTESLPIGILRSLEYNFSRDVNEYYKALGFNSDKSEISIPDSWSTINEQFDLVFSKYKHVLTFQFPTDYLVLSDNSFRIKKDVHLIAKATEAIVRNSALFFSKPDSILTLEKGDEEYIEYAYGLFWKKRHGLIESCDKNEFDTALFDTASKENLSITQEEATYLGEGRVFLRLFQEKQPLDRIFALLSNQLKNSDQDMCLSNVLDEGFIGKSVCLLLCATRQFNLLNSLVAQQILVLTDEQWISPVKIGPYAGISALYCLIKENKINLLPKSFLPHSITLISKVLGQKPKQGPGVGVTAFWWLIFHNQFDIIKQLLKQESVNSMRLTEEPQDLYSEVSPLPLLCSTPEGLALLVSHWDFFKKFIDGTGLFARATEGNNQGMSPFGLLCSTPEGLELLASHWDDFKYCIDKQGVFDQIDEGPNKGISPFWLLCRSSKGFELLMSHWDDFKYCIDRRCLFGQIDAKSSTKETSFWPSLKCRAFDAKIFTPQLYLLFIKKSNEGMSPFELLCRTNGGLTFVMSHWDDFKAHIKDTELSESINNPISYPLVAFLSSTNEGKEMLRLIKIFLDKDSRESSPGGPYLFFNRNHTIFSIRFNKALDQLDCPKELDTRVCHVANLFNVTIPLARSFISGQSSPSKEDLESIANILGVTPLWLFGEEGQSDAARAPSI